VFEELTTAFLLPWRSCGRYGNHESFFGMRIRRGGGGRGRRRSRRRRIR